MWTQRLMGLGARVNTLGMRHDGIAYVAQMMQKSGQGYDHKVLAFPHLAVFRSESLLTRPQNTG
jgi:hypothetical protein